MGKRGRPCTICRHPEREEIDKRLAPSGAIFAAISRDFAGISEDALKRHKGSHIPAALVKAESIKEVAKAETLLDDIRALREKAAAILEKAETAGDLKIALLGIREARGCIELLAKVDGQLKEGPQITIINNPEWVELRTLIITALDSYPDAKEAVVYAIRGR
jgi:hypothetical protein